MEWSAVSPNLNPIIHMWDMLTGVFVFILFHDRLYKSSYGFSLKNGNGYHRMTSVDLHGECHVVINAHRGHRCY